MTVPEAVSNSQTRQDADGDPPPEAGLLEPAPEKPRKKTSSKKKNALPDVPAAVTPMMDSDMDAVYGRVANRVRPSERGDPQEHGILTIDQSGPECAFAKVYICLGDKHFIDYLTLLKVDGRWCIITKTFTAQDRDGVAPL